MQTGQRNIVFDIPMQLVGVPHAYNKGVLACKSILKEVFERQQKQEASHAD